MNPRDIAGNAEEEEEMHDIPATGDVYEGDGSSCRDTEMEFGKKSIIPQSWELWLLLGDLGILANSCFNELGPLGHISLKAA